MQEGMFKDIELGAVALGDVGRFSESTPVGKLLFRCKKDGFDYLGQAGIDVREPSLRIEVFNGNYYTRFESPKDAVHSALESRILVLLSGSEKIPASYVSAIRSLVEKRTPTAPVTLDAPDEKVPELQDLLDRLNREYFAGKVDARIQWGRNTLGQNQRSVRFGSYDFKKKLIRINPRLRQDFVPVQVLELTVYHEMCHQALPPFRHQGKRLAHHAQFKQKEREYKFYRMVKQWEKQYWRKLMAPHPVES